MKAAWRSNRGVADNGGYLLKRNGGNAWPGSTVISNRSKATGSWLASAVSQSALNRIFP